MLTHIRHFRAAMARLISLSALTLLSLSGAHATGIPGQAPAQTLVQIIAVRSTAAMVPSTANSDATSTIAQLLKSGATVRRSEFLTVTSGTASSIDQPARTGLGAMAVIMPRFNIDGSVTLCLSLTEEDSGRQLSAVRTFHADGVQFVGQTEAPSKSGNSGVRTLVFLCVRKRNV